MRGMTYNRILAGTALALVLGAPVGAWAAPETTASIEAAVPMPDSPALPPPTAADVNGQPATSGVGSTETAPTGETTSAPAPEGNPAPATETATAPQTPPPDPLASLDPADRPIAEKVRDQLAAKVDRIFSNKKERTAVETFYQNRNLAPLWFDKGIENARAKVVIARIKEAATDGLDPNEYRLPNLSGENPDALAEAELRLTATVITFARHLQAGRFPFARISRDIEMPQQPPDTADVLTRLADAPDAGKVLDAFSPPQEGYKKLKAALADMRGKTTGHGNQIAEGPVLKLQKVLMEDSRVPQLRERLGVAGDPADLRYDAKLAEAVKKFQRANDLNATGALDARTVRELNGPPRDRQIDVIIANMERWRWLPRDLGEAHVVLNIPNYTLRVMRDDKLVWQTKVVVGKPTTATPLLTETMKYITINPTWNVPPSIVQNEYLPALAQDPTVLSRMGLHVSYNRDGSVHISQPPGERNALGRIRFNFPNRFLVYQHDTPDKHLFAHDKRAYSHGCMRVEDPARYAEVLFSIARPNDGYTQERIRKMFGTSEQDIQLPKPIPVHITYQSAFVDDAGKLQIRPDIYGLDGRTMAAIKGERGMIEVASERARPASSGGGVVRARPPQQRSVSFFEQLFGGGQPAPVPQRRIR